MRRAVLALGSQHDPRKVAMYACVRREFGVKRSGKELALANDDWLAIHARQHLDLGPDVCDDRSANENRLKRWAGLAADIQLAGSFGMADGTGELPAVGIA